MLISGSVLLGYQVHANDGEVGTISDLLFDDEKKIIRYMVINCGDWLHTEEVILSSVAFEEPDHVDFSISTILSRHAIAEAPSVNTKSPVSKQDESRLAAHYDWPMFWGSIPEDLDQIEQDSQQSDDSHLRSLREVQGYTLHCPGGNLGHVDELIVDTSTWTLRYLTVDTGTWLPGKKVIFSIDWLEEISWEGQYAYVSLTREEVKNAPRYNPRTPINRDYESEVYDYYGRPTYWKKAEDYSLYE